MTRCSRYIGYMSWRISSTVGGDVVCWQAVGGDRCPLVAGCCAAALNVSAQCYVAVVHLP